MLSTHPSRSQMPLLPPMTAIPSTFTLSLFALHLQVACDLPCLLLPSEAQVSAVLLMVLPPLDITCQIPLHLSILIFTNSGRNWSACPYPHLKLGLARKLSLYLSCAFPVKSFQFVYVCSCDSPHLCPIQ